MADRQSNFDLTTGKQLFAGKDGNSRALYEAYHKQFMPRIGLAWIPGLLGDKLVVRAGYAIIELPGRHRRQPAAAAEPAVLLRVRHHVRSLDAGRYPHRVHGRETAERALGPGARLGSAPAAAVHAAVEPEHGVPAFQHGLVDGGVRGPEGHAPGGAARRQPAAAGHGSGEHVAPLQERRPLYATAPLITNIATTDCASTMDYHSLQVSGRKRMAHGVEFLASYTFSKTLTDNRGFYGGGTYIAGEGAYWQNAYNRAVDRGRAFFDARHNVTFGGTWDIPVGKGRTFGRTWNRALDAAFGGWSTNFIMLAHSGFPVTILGTDQTIRRYAATFGRIPIDL